jgi:hypothetical protein
MGNKYDPMLEFKNKQPCHYLSKLEILLHYYYYKIKIKKHDMIISFFFTYILNTYNDIWKYDKWIGNGND